MLKFSAPKGMEIEGIRCDNLLDKNASINKYNTLNKRYNAKDINKYGNRFKNTLFNFMSKIDLSKDQDKIEVYDYLDTNNNKNTRLVYNLKIKCRVSTYSQYNFKEKNGTEIDVENTDSDDIREKKVNKFNNTNMANVKFISMDDKSESNYSRVLSEMVKKNYINPNIISRITIYIQETIETLVRNQAPNQRYSVFNFKEDDNRDFLLRSEAEVLEEIRYRVYVEVDDCLTQILMYHGDLSKVDKKYIPDDLLIEYKQRLLYSLDEKDEKILRNPSSNPVILTSSEIDKDLVSTYREYVNLMENRVLHDNYTSYGDLRLYQNETMFIYRIPIDMECTNLKN